MTMVEMIVRINDRCEAELKRPRFYWPVAYLFPMAIIYFVCLKITTGEVWPEEMTNIEYGHWLILFSTVAIVYSLVYFVVLLVWVMSRPYAVPTPQTQNVQPHAIPIQQTAPPVIPTTPPSAISTERKAMVSTSHRQNALPAVQLMPPIAKKVPIVPVRITQEALEAMYREAMNYPEDEVGWQVYGLINRVTSEVAIYGVISDPTTQPRSVGRVVFGSEIVAKKLTWLQANFQVLQSQNPQFADWYMDGLFKGHSHHQLRVYQYSSIDDGSIIETIRDDGYEVAVGPLVNIEQPDRFQFQVDRHSGRVDVRNEGHATIRFYYLSRQMWDAGQRRPVTVIPQLTKALEISAPMPWHLMNPRLYAKFVNPLRKAGFEVVEAYMDREALPLKIQFRIFPPNQRDTMVVLTTPYNYPEVPPTIEIAITQDGYDPEIVPIGLEWWPDYHLADTLGLMNNLSHKIIQKEEK